MPATAVANDLGIDMDKVKASFNKVKEGTRRNKVYSPCRIRINGELVTLRNGKGLWRQIGHCKSAIRNHLEGASYDFVRGYGTQDVWKKRRDVVNYIMDNWVGVGSGYPIEIVPVDGELAVGA